ncbi:MAG: hypothetical protein R3E95_11555 [Thiolinea sp.]
MLKKDRHYSGRQCEPGSYAADGDGADSLLADTNGHVGATCRRLAMRFIRRPVHYLNLLLCRPLLQLTDSTPDQAEEAQTLYRRVRTAMRWWVVYRYGRMSVPR